MRLKKSLLALCFFAALAIKAQDTTRVIPATEPGEKKEKIINHEIGFNFLAMASQFDLITPVPGQQPYYAMYNIYYKDKVGLRLGAGFFSNNDQSEIEGTTTPSITVSEQIDLRMGVTANIARERRVTINAFADFLLIRNKFESITSSTVQVFPDPIITETNQFTNTGDGYGFQAGFGVKLDIYKNLSLYTEMPFGWKLVTHNNYRLITDDGGGYDQNIERTYSSSYFLTLPVSVYLILRF